MAWAIGANSLAAPESRRSAAAGISAISAFILLSTAVSAMVAVDAVDREAQVSVVLLQQRRCPVGLQPQAEQHGDFHVAVGLRDETRCVFRAAIDDLPDHAFGAP